ERRERDLNPRCFRTSDFESDTIGHSDIPPETSVISSKNAPSSVAQTSGFPQGCHQTCRPPSRGLWPDCRTPRISDTGGSEGRRPLWIGKKAGRHPSDRGHGPDSSGTAPPRIADTADSGRTPPPAHW